MGCAERIQATRSAAVTSGGKGEGRGSRLILAHARRGQCMAFEHIDKIENAIAACREAGDIFAAAGDREDEASSLRTWADAISQTDASESIRLYKQAQEVFRGNGSERGVAGILNNLALVYEAQGDPATAEKMQRQLSPVFVSWTTKAPRRRLWATSRTNDWSRGTWVARSSSMRNRGS